MRRRSRAFTFMVWAIWASLAQAQDFGKQEQKLNISDCPKAIQKSIRQEANKGKVGDVILKKEDGVTIYTVSVQLAELQYEVLVRQDGVLLSKVLQRGEGEAQTTKTGPAEAIDGGAAEKKISLKMAALPKKVQKTLKQEGRGGEIEGLVKVEKGNEVLYRAEAEIGERDYEIEIDDNGTLLKKTLAKDGDRDHEDEDEDDD